MAVASEGLARYAFYAEVCMGGIGSIELTIPALHNFKISLHQGNPWLPFSGLLATFLCLRSRTGAKDSALNVGLIYHWFTPALY